MASNSRYSQPGLEVVPESDFPQVIQGPTTIHKAWDPTSPSQPQPLYYQHQQYQPPQFSPSTPYVQQQQYPFPPQTPYDGSPTQPPQSLWAPSQVGTIGPSASEKFYPGRSTICGIRARKFWLIVGPLLAVLVIAVAVGLGVGLGTSHSSSETASSATPTPTVSSISCPSDNSTIYASTTDSKTFLVRCNIDYNSGGGTEDIEKVVTATAADCANTCAANGACTGAGWGDYYGTTYCWMKSSLGTPQNAPNWYFMIKQ